MVSAPQEHCNTERGTIRIEEEKSEKSKPKTWFAFHRALVLPAREPKPSLTLKKWLDHSSGFVDGAPVHDGCNGKGTSDGSYGDMGCESRSRCAASEGQRCSKKKQQRSNSCTIQGRCRPLKAT